jgi:hypothetical protein
MRLTIVFVLLAACGPAQRAGDDSSGGRQGTPCGGGTCSVGSICVPGGTARNGIGDTVELPPEHCMALPAACNGVASCSCLGDACPIGGCASIDGGRLICLAAGAAGPADAPSPVAPPAPSRSSCDVEWRGQLVGCCVKRRANVCGDAACKARGGRCIDGPCSGDRSCVVP